MGNFWSIVLNIVIFIVSLGALIIIHELGHLTTAKIFKVYCYEFSVGMGPALFKHKRKKGETIFSIRAFPIGGYVAMAGEDMGEDEKDDASSEIVVPKERTIEGISRWKRIIIMGAGVFLNFILGYLLFFINYAAVEQVGGYYDSTKITVAEDSIAGKSGFIKNDDEIIEISQIFYYADGTKKELLNKEVTCYTYQNSSEVTYDNYNLAIGNILSAKYLDVEASKAQNKAVYIDYEPKAEGDYREIYFTYKRDGIVYTNGSEGKYDGVKSYQGLRTSAKWVNNAGNQELHYDIVGIGLKTFKYRYSFAQAFVVAWNQWCYACSAIFIGLGTLFTPAGWAGAGGIISIFKISTIAVSNGISSVLNMWGLISVNLGIMNLLPFPGLDGWQILVTSVEGVTRKEIPSKVKGIVSTIGLILLIALSIVLIIKDIVAPAI